MANNPIGSICIIAPNEVDMLAFCKDYAQQDHIGEVASVKEYVDLLNAYVDNLPWDCRYNYLPGMARVDGMSYESPTSIRIWFCVSWLSDIKEWVEKLLENHPSLMAKGSADDCQGGIVWDFEYAYNKESGKREFLVAESVSKFYFEGEDAGGEDVCVETEPSDQNADSSAEIREYIWTGDKDSCVDVVVPEGIIRMGCCAFANCPNLTRVVLPDSVERLDERLFEGCTSLTSVLLPIAIKSISRYAFARCVNLKSINIPADVRVIGEAAFKGCTGLTEVVIPEKVTHLAKSVFSGCTALRKVVLPEGLLDIGECAFNGCSSLTEVVMTNRNVQIGRAAFDCCPKLTNTNLPVGCQKDKSPISGELPF